MILRDKVYLYGGVGNDVCGDMNILSMKDEKWEWIEQDEEGRLGHNMEVYKDKIIIFGGEKTFNQTIKQRECYNDIRLYDDRTNRLTKLRCCGELPEPIWNAGSCIFDKYLLIHGGINNKGNY